MANEPAAGWYPDPNTPGQRRYWDGSKWTEHTDAKEKAEPAEQPAQPQAAQPAQPQAAQPQAAQPQAPTVQPQAVAQPGGFVPQPGGAVAAKPGLPPLAIAGFVCGVVGLLFSLTIICSLFPGLELGIVGIVLSALGSRQAAERGVSKGLPTAGLICGIVAVLIGVGVGIAAAVS